ncbi:hypothetical protein G7068_13625 [Leucobacter viscericola]|uniref:Uncharacterized protein n=1 Tax=Leucobacter viscericola TaxID=2714935 RepID=A0A6G7XIC2_9MICO|nr:hypothetical protein [Leucobacter viscericola]QIK64118.1 hypothetical protein G7068_13625 [Leucobacter viscericola]
MSENLVTANHKYAEAIGRDFGPASNEVQGALLNGFLHSLNVACSHNPGMQIAYIVDELSAESRKLITEFAGAIEVSK